MNDQSPRERVRPIVLIAVACCIVLVGFLVWRSRAPAPAPPVTQAAEPAAAVEPAPAVVPPAAPAASTLEQQWGIQVSSIILTNADTVVDLRYMIVAPDKTALLGETNTDVYLIDQATGTKLPMLTAAMEGGASPSGPSRSVRRMMHQAGRFPPAPSRMLVGRTNSLQIPNWDNALKSGSKVTFVVGNSRVENLIVE